MRSAAKANTDVRGVHESETQETELKRQGALFAGLPERKAEK